MFCVSIYWGFHHPNWRSYFSEGFKPPTSESWSEVFGLHLDFQTLGETGLKWTLEHNILRLSAVLVIPSLVLVVLLVPESLSVSGYLLYIYIYIMIYLHVNWIACRVVYHVDFQLCAICCNSPGCITSNRHMATWLNSPRSEVKGIAAQINEQRI